MQTDIGRKAKVSPYTCRNIDSTIAHLENVVCSDGASFVFSTWYWRSRVLEAYATFGLAPIQKERLYRLLERIDAL